MNPIPLQLPSMTAPASPREADSYPAAALAVPFRAILLAVMGGAASVQIVDLVSGQYLRGALIALIVAVGIVAWRLAARGAVEGAAALLLGFVAVALTTRMWVGNGLRDFGIAAYPAVLFLGCVFLQARVYWALAALVVSSAVAVGLGDIYGLRAASPIPVRPGNLVNLVIILVVCAAGGRALMTAIRSGFARERELRGALATSEDRMDKIFRATQNAIVVSRVEDGLYHDVNDAYLNMFGYERTEVIGRSSLVLGIWEDPRERERFVRDASRRGGARGFDTRLRRRSGETFEAQLSAERLTIDGVDFLVVSVADVSAQRHAQRRVEHLATRDSLTGLPNRMLALDRLERAMEHARRYTSAIGVLHLDIDGFGALNESLGRDAGDELLRQAAARVEAMLLPGDSLARVGPDELLYIAASLESPERLQSVAKRIAGAFERPFSAAGQNAHMSCGVGACTYPADGSDAETLLAHAESALRVAKLEGRGRCCVFDRVMVEQVRDRLVVQGGLREAIAHGTLRLAYQPKFSLADGRVTGFEALARWSHPELGEVPPARFIAIAEESDLIVELGNWVLNEACAQQARWRAAGLALLPVAVNLSARQLEPGLGSQIAEAATIHGLDPSLIELEVTESMLITRPEVARRLLQQVAARGSRVVLDDFGVGYSSLGYLKHLPLHGIKIDRSFVDGVAADLCDVAIVGAMVNLAHGLGIRVIAEGIEHPEQLEALKAAGCDEGQGFLLGRPADPAEIASRLLAPAAPAIPA